MMRSRRKLLVLLVAAIGMLAGACAVAVVAWRWSRKSLPAPGSPIYQAMVSAFYTGAAAMDTDAPPMIARDSLARAAKLVPEEPATWANLGLLAIRENNFETAGEDLEIARRLAPENGKIHTFLALLEDRKGNIAASIAQGRIAVSLDPRDLKTRFELAKQLDRAEEEGSAAEALLQLVEMQKLQPENLPVLMESARLAAKTGNLEAIHEILGHLKKRSIGWPPTALQPLHDLELAVEGKNLRRSTIPALLNQLKILPEFQRDLDAIQPSKGKVGEPIAHFLRLPLPSPTPAPPDVETTFATSPMAKQDSRKWDGLVALLPPDDAPPRFFVADAREVRPIDGNGEPLPFPGGAANVPPSPEAILAVDWNSDYAMDLLLAGAGGLRFFQQGQGGKFTDVTAATGLAAELLSRDLHGVWAADFDLDGDLDFVAGPRTGPPFVIRNHGNGTFSVVRPFDPIADLRQCLWVDLDQDGTPDFAFLGKSQGLHVFMNERAGRYREKPLPKELGRIVAMTAADSDDDGLMEILALRENGTIARISNGPDDRSWDVGELARWAGIPSGEVRLFAADLDNNGALDLIGTSREGSRIWLGGEDNRLHPTSTNAELMVTTIVDVNGDGRLDLAGLDGQSRPTRALNQGKLSYRWQALHPRAARKLADGRINSFGVGGIAEIRAGLIVQTQPITGPSVHFGLGRHPGADVTRLVWPNGTSQVEFHLKSDRVNIAEQRLLKSSCPFVYAFNGEKIEFVTDFLWRSPLGLRINAQDTAGSSQTEDWVKIREDQLVARDGHYDIRLTAELWETHYWDHVSLMLVEHPKGTDIFVDERFARVAPPLEVHTVSTPRPVAMARDDDGHDVTRIVSSRDGVYLDNFGRGSYQGVAKDHWVEVEIGDDWPRDRRPWLVANGWIHPTDSSINVAISQGDHPKPQGLVLEVATADGGWITARDDLGFPAGKNKTILIDLEGVFRADAPRRLRLRTNLEIFWDSLAIAVDATYANVKTRRIAPETAELRPRGYSRIDRTDASSPELPDYDTLVGTGQKWRDLIGFYTRFGDVRELLEKVDDRYVIVNAGDEVAFRFPAPTPAAAPAGMVRDFVLIGDGWNKDGDFNTAFSKTVLPLPSHDHPSYDSPPTALEDDPVYKLHAGDWETYHTRYITPRRFRDALAPGDRR